MEETHYRYSFASRSIVILWFFTFVYLLIFKFLISFLSTNEELQATLQELADLQAQLTEQQSENERLTEEKGVLLESLRWQTEKLEDSRAKVDTLHELLLREEAGNGPGGGGDAAHGQAEREQKLVELLKACEFSILQPKLSVQSIL